VRTYTLLGQGMPQFWVGIMLILLLAVKAGLFPVGGYGETWGEHWYYLFLPALTLAIAMSPTTIRSLRASTINVLGADYVGTARSKGAAGVSLFRGHVLRNAAIPITTVVGITITSLIALSSVVERAFSLDGLGAALVQAALSKDFAVVQGIALIFVAAFVVANALVDVLYAFMDPRVAIGSRAS